VKAQGARDLKAQAAGEALAAGRPPSLRDRLAQYFRSGQNASDRELAAMFGASVGSISVYRCQLKKQGVGVASPSGTRAAPGTKRSRAKSAKRARASAVAVAAEAARKATPAAEVASRAGGNPLSLAEIDQVLVQNIETELGLIVERHPELARAVANVQQTVRLLLKLHRA
jgi:hypothetical protein